MENTENVGTEAGATPVEGGTKKKRVMSAPILAKRLRRALEEANEAVEALCSLGWEVSVSQSIGSEGEPTKLDVEIKRVEREMTL